jgi:cell division protein FtsI/penicillin-binding protein 2
VTPLQVARAYAVVANGGDLVRPHLIARIGGDQEYVVHVEKRSVGLREETIAALRAGLEAAVGPGGTAERIATAKYGIAGKTGTAQAPGGRPHAWFAGYAPSDRPKLVVVVVIEHGGEGSEAAAPVARHVLDTALLPRAEVACREERPSKHVAAMADQRLVGAAGEAGLQ